MENITEYHVRKAGKNDLDFLYEVFANARRYMIVMGNPNEWGDTYPENKMTKADVKDGICYIVETPKEDILATFCLSDKPDEAYDNIASGKWLDEKPYVVLSKIASTGYARQVADFVLQWCTDNYANIRTETHRLNNNMRAALMRHGFKLCGVVTREGHEPLLALHHRKQAATDSGTTATEEAI